MSLLSRVEGALRRSGMAASRFGRRAANDPHLVHDLRRGRQVGAALEARIVAEVEAMEAPGPSERTPITIRAGER